MVFKQINVELNDLNNINYLIYETPQYSGYTGSIWDNDRGDRWSQPKTNTSFIRHLIIERINCVNFLKKKMLIPAAAGGQVTVVSDGDGARRARSVMRSWISFTTTRMTTSTGFTPFIIHCKRPQTLSVTGVGIKSVSQLPVHPFTPTFTRSL